MRILITGSRDWANRDMIHEALTDAVRGLPVQSVVVVHGAAPTGADGMVEEMVSRWSAFGWLTEPHPADWGTFGRRAGMVRNAEMVKLGADVCLAFIRPCSRPYCRQPRPHGSHGTERCAELAERAGIEVLRFYAP